MKKAKDILNMIGKIAGVIGFLSTGASYTIDLSEKISKWSADRAALKAVEPDVVDDFDDDFEEVVTEEKKEN